VTEDPFALDVVPPRSNLLLPAEIERYVEAERLAELARKGAGAAATLRGYRADWGVFTRWCAERNLCALPADALTVARYVRYLIDRPRRTIVEEYLRGGKVVRRERREGPATTATVERHIVSIRMAHRLRGHPDPTLDETFVRTWKGVRRERGTKPRNQKQAVNKERLIVAVAAIAREHRLAIAAARSRGAERGLHSRELQLLRDNAILLLGWSGALRRTELAGIEFAHVGEEDEGLHIDLPHSKTNQEGEREFVLIHRARDPELCAVRAVQAWQAALAALEPSITDGRLFRRIDRHGNVGESLQSVVVNALVKRSASAAGLDPTVFGAHSLRAGWITSGAQAGLHEATMMKHSRHLSIAVFRGYVREANKWRERDGLRLL
jgi:integrase